MTRSRKEPTLKAKLAATLRELLKIPYDEARLLTTDQIISRVEFHHIHYHAQDGVDDHWNLDPLPKAEHKERTAKIDIPQIWKTKRISKAEAEFRTRLLTPRDERPAKKSKWASRPFPKKRKSL